MELKTHRSYTGVPGLQYVLDFFKDIIKNDFVEIMSHPGYVDAEVLNNSSYVLQRVEELKILMSEELRNLIKEYKVELITYATVTCK